MKKKTLTAHVPFDVTLLTDKAIDALKSYIATVYEDSGLNVSFEISEIDEESSLERLFKSIQQEFTLQDQATPDLDLDQGQGQDAEATLASDNDNVTDIAAYLSGKADNESTPPLD
jgi:hypothetical protein